MESDADEGAEFSLSSSPEEVSPDEESPSASGTFGVGAPPTACRIVFTDFRELERHVEERGGEGTGNEMFITDNSTGI